MTEPGAAGGAALELWAEREPDGRLRSTWLRLGDDGATWSIEERHADEGPRGAPLSLPAGALAAVFARYGKPLAAPAPPADASAPPLRDAAGALVRTFSFMRWGDVLPQTYVLFHAPGAEPLVAPAPLVAAALLHLGTRTTISTPGK